MHLNYYAPQVSYISLREVIIISGYSDNICIVSKAE